MDKVLVLMSVYNGEKYLKAQLDSILNQRSVLIDILIRDDGSEDGSLDIISRYILNHSNIYLYKGKNLGAAMSFMNLINRARNLCITYDYYALSDQDDIWLENKLLIAIKKMKELEKHNNILYSSAYTPIDDDFNILYNKKIVKYSKYEYFLRNNLPGCTMVFNRKLLETISFYKPQYIEMHDSWILRILLITNGNLIIDNNSQTLYRQHNGNLIGVKKNSLYVNFINRLKISFSYNHVTSQTCAELLKGYGNLMSKEDIDFCYKFQNYRKIKDKIMLINMSNKIEFSTFSRKLFYILDIIIGNI